MPSDGNHSCPLPDFIATDALTCHSFSCTGQESTEPWSSPSAAQVTFQSLNQSIPEILSPPLSPPGVSHGPQRSIAKSSALKLITTFGDQGAKSKFFAAGDGGQTPIAAGVTPIAESAVSPGGHDPTTAVLKPSSRSTLNTPTSSVRVTTPGGFSRRRLPSIGEVRGEAPPPVPALQAQPQRSHQRQPSSEEQYNAGLSLARAATASPMMMRDSHRRKEAPPPSPSPESFVALMAQGRSSRNGARDRVPDGIDLKLQSMDAAMAGEVTSPEQSVTSSTRFHWPTRRRGPGSIASSVTSNSSAGRSHRGRPVGAKSLNNYISSLDTAQDHHNRQRSRESSRSRQDDRNARSQERSRSRKGTATREVSADRGRAAARNYIPKPAKRSPTSPIPMSPEDLINLSTPRNDDPVIPLRLDVAEPPTVRKVSQIRRSSPNSMRASSRPSSRDRRRKSPERRPPALALDTRGRGDGRGEGSIMRSPSSPLPMSAQGHFFGSDDENDYKAAVDAQESFRNRHNRSRGLKDQASPAVSRARDRSESRRRNKVPGDLETQLPAVQMTTAVVEAPKGAGDLKQILTERQLKKEAAARELEERRRSLAQRPSAPPIPHPHELSPIASRPPTAFEFATQPSAPLHDIPQRSATADFARGSNTRSGSRPVIGLPATPKAMRLQFETDNRAKPSVPPIPSVWTKTSPPSSGQGSPAKVPEDAAKPSPQAAPDAAPSLLTLLPSTVYSPPSRPNIPRCMSAPIADEPSSSFSSVHQPSGHSRQGSSGRKMSTPDVSMRGIDQMIGGGRHSRRASRDDYIPPPPPPPPPMLKELQHLATPPPPPPAPLPGAKPQVYGGQGTIEIVMDEDDNVPAAVPANDANVPILAAPAPPQTRHARGRSISDKENSIASRISRATDRMRSASRGRNSSTLGSRTKSPEQTSPYESVLPPVSYTSPTTTPSNAFGGGPSMTERHPREVRAAYHQHHNSGTGLSRSELI